MIGACGLSCDHCGLLVAGICTTCGSGTSEEAKQKLQFQQQNLGLTCGPLACAVEKGVPYCSRDCADFPCAKYEKGPYPHSQAYLDVYRKRQAGTGFQEATP